jgi:hypothetical protein
VEEGLRDVDTEVLMKDARSLAPPQDLRYIVAYINSSNERSVILKLHISELRKSFIVKQISSSLIEVSLRVGVTANIRIHDCYPDTPNGVYVDSIYDDKGQSSERMKEIREEANSIIVHSVIDVVMFLKKELTA